MPLESFALVTTIIVFRIPLGGSIRQKSRRSIEALRSLPVKTAYLDGELGATEFGTPSCTKSDICPQLRASSRR
jgi:hypothetical protein